MKYTNGQGKIKDTLDMSLDQAHKDYVEQLNDSLAEHIKELYNPINRERGFEILLAFDVDEVLNTVYDDRTYYTCSYIMDIPRENTDCNEDMRLDGRSSAQPIITLRFFQKQCIVFFSDSIDIEDYNLCNHNGFMSFPLGHGDAGIIIVKDYMKTTINKWFALLDPFILSP